MAGKRMFTMKIVDSDAFLDMPLSAQCLYFHLNMRADDDGFIGNAKRILREVRATDDDLNILISKRFVIQFEDGVIVIKHWWMHNTLMKDRYHETAYTDEKRALTMKDNRSYTLSDNGMLTECIQTVNSGLGLGLDKDLDIDIDIDKDLTITVSKDTVCQTQDVRLAIDEWNKLSDFGISSVSKINSESKRYKNISARIKQYGIDDVLKAISLIRESDFLQGKNNRNWMITFDWFALPSNFPKVLDGNYKNRTSEDAKQDYIDKWRDA